MMAMHIYATYLIVRLVLNVAEWVDIKIAMLECHASLFCLSIAGSQHILNFNDLAGSSFHSHRDDFLYFVKISLNPS